METVLEKIEGLETIDNGALNMLAYNYNVFIEQSKILDEEDMVITNSDKIKGIIYLYISPSLKCYVGQTINEEKRRLAFLNLNSTYGGKLIDNERKKYKPENFVYVVLYIN